MSDWRWQPPEGFSCMDVLAFLRSLPDGCVDLFETDPPYAFPGGFMGLKWDKPDSNAAKAVSADPSYAMDESKWDAPERVRRIRKASAEYDEGMTRTKRYAERRGSGVNYAKDIEAFKSFSAWCEAWAKECLRTLRPGGFLLAMGAPKTYDALAWGIRMAGFELRDCISWVYAQGMPKGADIARLFGKTGPDAVLWKGYDIALKPAHELICVARKPFSQTIIQNLREHGTGAMDIDAGRIAAKGPVPGWFQTGTVGSDAAKGFMGTSTFRIDERTPEDVAHVAEDHAAGGRWPPNLLLSHADGCVKVGSKKVPARVINRFDDGAKPFGGGAGHPFTTTKTGDADGLEATDEFVCVDGCPVKVASEAWGTSKSGKMRAGQPRKKSKGVGFAGTQTFAIESPATSRDTIADEGSATRFFVLADEDAPSVAHAEGCKVVGQAPVRGDKRAITRKGLGGKREPGFLQPGEPSGDGKPNAEVYAEGGESIYECVTACPVAQARKDLASLDVGFYSSKVHPRDRKLDGYMTIVPKSPKGEAPGVDEALAKELCALWSIPQGVGETWLETMIGWPIPYAAVEEWAGGHEPNKRIIQRLVEGLGEMGLASVVVEKPEWVDSELALRWGMFVSAKHLHPTTKPLSLGRWISKVYSPRPETVGRPVIVCDPFGGSGTFALAAALEGRTPLYNDFTMRFTAVAAARFEMADIKPIPTSELRAPEERLWGGSAVGLESTMDAARDRIDLLANPDSLAVMHEGMSGDNTSHAAPSGVTLLVEGGDGGPSVTRSKELDAAGRDAFAGVATSCDVTNSDFVGDNLVCRNPNTSHDGEALVKALGGEHQFDHEIVPLECGREALGEEDTPFAVVLVGPARGATVSGGNKPPIPNGGHPIVGGDVVVGTPAALHGKEVITQPGHVEDLVRWLGLTPREEP